MRKINKIILHCSATKEGKDYRAKDIKQWHLQRGFNDIGYHYVIDLDGTVETGRDISKIGAHCTGHNSDSIGICYIGGLDAKGNPKDTRTQKQKESLYKLIAELTNKYKCSVHCHNEYSNKACPSFTIDQI